MDLRKIGGPSGWLLVCIPSKLMKRHQTTINQPGFINAGSHSISTTYFLLAQDSLSLDRDPPDTRQTDLCRDAFVSQVFVFVGEFLDQLSRPWD